MKALEQHIKEQTSWIDLEQPKKANADKIEKKSISRRGVLRGKTP